MRSPDSAPSELAPFRDAGWALHWLHAKSKRPIGNDWSDVPVATLDQLLATHQQGNNLGVRLGLPSQMADGSYLHVLDIDIRVRDLADEAWLKLAELFPNIDLPAFPTVISGSGGESRHIYFCTSTPFYSRKLAVSEGKHSTFDAERDRHVWHYDWEIELFGTGKQVAMPPSIHPDTGKPYIWEREFDFDMLALGIGPTIAADRLEKIATAQSETYAFETREPLTFKEGQLESELDELTVEFIDDRDTWIMLGQALHHQFGGAKEGFDLWMKASSRGSKYLVNSKLDDEYRRYRQFGRNCRAPVTMASVRQWVLDQRQAAMISQFDDIDDFDDPEPDTDEFDDLLGTSKKPLPTVDEFEALLNGKDDELDWRSLLGFTSDGVLKNNLHNVTLILQNDPRTRGLPQINEFTNEVVQRKSPGSKSSRKNAAKPTPQLDGKIWTVSDPVNGHIWTDDRDFSLRRIFEAPKSQGGYEIKVSDRDLKAAVSIAANDASFHPIREYLRGLSWDGHHRAEMLFVDYLGADDNAYSREIAKLILLGAVVRVFEPGHKFDFVPIIEGLQGKRKSTLIRTLGVDWFAELDGDFRDQKLMVERMQGAWILELPELSGFRRAEVQTIKAFVSRSVDRVRLAYARRGGDFPRQCIFIASTNDSEYLRDQTGNRRFWPIACTISEIDIDKLKGNVAQIWAEAYHLYCEMRRKQPKGMLPLYLTSREATDIATDMQEIRRIETVEDGVAGQIQAWLDAPINEGGFEDFDDTGTLRYRNETCLLEIWTKCLGGDIKSYLGNQVQQQALGRSMRHVTGWQKRSSKRAFDGLPNRQAIFTRIENNSRDLIG